MVAYTREKSKESLPAASQSSCHPVCCFFLVDLSIAVLHVCVGVC